jgi:hypothetical protein
VLEEISLVSDQEAHTQWRVTVGVATPLVGEYIQTALTLVLPSLALAAGSIVKVEAKSDDGTAIVADASITGKELG